MIKLTIYGKEHPVDEEIELFDESDYGMDITIKYNDSHRGAKIETRHNCTEFHHLYNIKDWPEEQNEWGSAFESDLHMTGGTKRLHQLEWVEVKKATKLNEEY